MFKEFFILTEFGKFGRKIRHVMIKRLPNRFTGECSGYLCVYIGLWIHNHFVHQNVKDFIHKNSKINIYRFISQPFNHHKQLWQFGKRHLENKKKLPWRSQRLHCNRTRYGGEENRFACLVLFENKHEK